MRNEKLELMVTDLDTGEVAYRFDVAGQGVVDSQGKWSFGLGGAVAAGRYKFEINTLSTSGVTLNGEVDGVGELAFELDLGVKFGVDGAWVTYQDELSVFDVAQERYLDDMTIYDLEVKLRSLLIRQMILTDGLEDYVLEGNELVKYEEVEVGGIFSGSGWSDFGLTDEAQDTSDLHLVLVNDIDYFEFSNEVIMLALEPESDAAGRVFTDEELVMLDWHASAVGSHSEMFDAIRAAYFAKYGVAYETELPSAVPEPGSLALLSLLGGFVMKRRVG